MKTQNQTQSFIKYPNKQNQMKHNTSSAFVPRTEEKVMIVNVEKVTIPKVDLVKAPLDRPEIFVPLPKLIIS